MAFQEKTLWLMLVGLVAAFGFYFTAVLGVPLRTANVMPHQVVFFTLAIVLLVVTQVVGAIVLAILDRRTEPDERDRLIGLTGARNSGYVLATGVFCALCTALLNDGNFLFTHVLLGFWVAAQLVEIVSRLYLYRRGA